MAPVPFTDPGARIAFDVVLGLFVVLEQRIRWRSRRRPAGTPADHGSLFVVIVAVSAGVGGAIALATGAHGAAIGFARWPVFGAGLVVMILGIALRQWSVNLLGEYFTVDVRVHAGQAVVTGGPYRLVRHPSYTGLILTLLGLGLALGNWASLAVLAVVPTAGLVVRIRAEERALLDGLGEPYRRFAAGRARLFPGIW